MEIKNLFLILILICSTAISKNLRSQMRDRNHLNCQTVPVYVEQAECEEEASPFLVQNEAMGDKALFVSKDYFKKEIQPKMECDYQPTEEESEEDREEFEKELAKFEENKLLFTDGDLIGGPGAEGLDTEHVNVNQGEIDSFTDGIVDGAEQQAIIEDKFDGSLVLDGRTRVYTVGDHEHEQIDRDNVEIWSPEEDDSSVPDDDYHPEHDIPVTATGEIDYAALETGDENAYEPYDLSSYTN
jgi:hypothetical protein